MGGCSLEAAEAVCDAKSDLGLDPLEGIGSLMDKSLLREGEAAGDEPRFVMLGTIREYGLERLASSGEEPLTRRAHAAYFLLLAEDKVSERARDLSAPRGASPGEESSRWSEQLEVEHDNLREAIDWLIETGEAPWGLRLGRALFEFWEEREYLAEGRERLEKVLALPGATPRTRDRARALFAAGVLAGEAGDEEAAKTFHQESLEISREQDDRKGVAVALNALAVGARNQGDLARSRSLFEESLALWRELGDDFAIVRSLSNLANVARLQGRFEDARSLFEECLAISRRLGDRAGIAWSLNQQGDIAREQGDAAAARSLYEQSLAMFREISDRWGIAGSLADLGNLARDQGDFATSRRLHRQSMKAFEELDHKRGIARLLECFACTAAADSRPESALRLAGAAAALRQAVGAVLTGAEQMRLEKALAPAREALTNAAGSAAWMEGWAMPLEAAIAEAVAS